MPRKPEKKSPASEAIVETAGRFAYDGLERSLHEKARLGIMTSLMAHPQGVVFNDLKELCALTDGNLNRHLKVLEDEQYIEIWKSHHQRRPQTLVRLTTVGRQRFLEYVAVLEQVVSDAAKLAAAMKESAPAEPAHSHRLGFAAG